MCMYGPLTSMHVHVWATDQHACACVGHWPACMYTCGPLTSMHVYVWATDQHACTCIGHWPACMCMCGPLTRHACTCPLTIMHVYVHGPLTSMHVALQIKKGPNKGQMVEQMKRQLAIDAVSSVSLRFAVNLFMNRLMCTWHARTVYM